MRTVLVLLILSIWSGCSGTHTSLTPGTDAVSIYVQGDPFNCNNQTCTGQQPGCCNNACVDLAEDSNNCGSCGQICTSATGVNATCQINIIGTGVCTSTNLGWANGNCKREPWQSYCGCHCQDGTNVTPTGGCSEYSSDPSKAQTSCQTECQNACSTGGHGNAIDACQDYLYSNFRNQCIRLNTVPNNVVCTTGYTSCNGSCRYLASDPNNCSSCGNICYPQTGIPQCLNGICMTPGRLACAQHTGANACDDNNCSWLPRGNEGEGLCISRMCLDYASELDCKTAPENSSCKWDSKKLECSPPRSCIDLLDPTSCATNSRCLWVFSECVPVAN